MTTQATQSAQSARVRTWAKRILTAAFALGVVGVAGPARAVVGPKIEVGRFALESGVFNAIFAKELCSCQFVDGLTLEECQARDNLPALSHYLVNLSVDPNTQTVSSGYKGRDFINEKLREAGIPEQILTVGGSATAHVDPIHPEFGCVLTKLPSEN